MGGETENGDRLFVLTPIGPPAGRLRRIVYAASKGQTLSAEFKIYLPKASPMYYIQSIY
jgi:hypothetical protein